jgi:hypothetical protein
MRHEGRKIPVFPRLRVRTPVPYSRAATSPGADVKDIIAGVVLIAIGFVFGGSIFLGDYSITSWIFDGLGILFIVMGLVKMYKSRQPAA